MIRITHALLDYPQDRQESASGTAGWLAETVLHPFINSAVIEPCDTVAHLIQDLCGAKFNPPELPLLSINKAAPYSTGCLLESAASGMGSLLPYLLSGKIAGKLLGGFSGLLGAEGRTAAFLTNGRLAQYSGAGLYAALKSPQPGESRLGDAVGTVAAFSLFDAGNALSNLALLEKPGVVSLAARSGLRAGTGFAAGLIQAELSSLAGLQGFAERRQVVQSGISGAFLNLAFAGLANNKSPADSVQSYRESLPRGVEARTLPQQSAVMKANAQIAGPEKANVAYIVIDSGFSPDSLPPPENILGVWDTTGEGAFNDPLHHGSVVLSKIKAGDPHAKFMLIRAYDGADNLAQTQFENGQIVRAGWTEAYLEAVALADKLHLPSVANCSFGEFSHAMDGTGWESFQLSHAIGQGREGHLLVAASGPGNGAPRHASGVVESGASEQVNISQNGEAEFNLWMAKDAPSDWNLSVYEGERPIYSVDGSQLARNFWNNRQQIRFRSQIDGEPAKLVLSRQGTDPRALNFDFWVQSGKAAFLDHLNPELISEPAVFPDVVAVGLEDGSYSPSQNDVGRKPDVLVPGPGPISFRTPEITLAVGKMLKGNPLLDAPQVQKLLGKHPRD